MPYCENCGSNISPNEKFCSSCGAKIVCTQQPSVQAVAQPQIQTVSNQSSVLQQSIEADEYHSATAKTADEARKLIEAGFEYVCDFNGVKLFRKIK